MSDKFGGQSPVADSNTKLIYQSAEFEVLR